MNIKNKINLLLGLSGYRLIKAPDPELPLIHQLRIEDYIYPFWITDPHTKNWWLKPNQDPSAEIQFLLEVCRKNSVFFDVGAHHGYQTVFAAKLATEGHVHAFEASPVCSLTLDANIGLNRLINVSSNLLAIGSESKVIEIQGQSIDARSLDSWTVQMTSLDSYCSDQKLSSIDVVKIDVEGYEGEVLAGAKNMLLCKPHINLELHLDHIGVFEWNAKSVLNQLPIDDTDYEISWIDRNNSWTTRRDFSQLDLSKQTGVVNLFLVNREKLK